jgi:ATP-dependent DNA helicase RecQ
MVQAVQHVQLHGAEAPLTGLNPVSELTNSKPFVLAYPMMALVCSWQSLCYQIPALVRDGIGVVISPLIALMQDQVDALLTLGVRAGFLNSTQDPNQRREVEAADSPGSSICCIWPPNGYVLSQRCGSSTAAGVPVRHRRGALRLATGHDFRPTISRRRRCTSAGRQTVPRIALTATATRTIHAEIASRLNLEDTLHHVTSFDRPNIQYRIVSKKEPQRQLLQREPGRGRGGRCGTARRPELIAAAETMYQ